ncbi:MAG: 50S ribosomal protein L6 [bacterium]
MSRIAKQPVAIPAGVEIKIDNKLMTVKGSKGSLELNLHPHVDAVLEDGQLKFAPKTNKAMAMTGTMRSLANNMVEGVSKGFQKKLTLVGVGYRASLQGSKLNMTLGFSHPIDYEAPEGITFEVPNQTEVHVNGCDKQKVGQVAAELRAFRPPEPYKGKGVRYADEHVVRKEAKKA